MSSESPLQAGSTAASQSALRPTKQLGLLWLLLALWPLVVPNSYIVSLGSTFFINLLLIASLNLLVGYTGLTSLAHAAFWGIGAYVSGIFAIQTGFSPWLGTLLAMLACALVACLIGLSTLRLSGHYLAMATLGFNAIVTVVLVAQVDWTGGPNGLIGIPSYTLGSYDLSDPTAFFHVTWIISALVMLSLLFFLRSRSGRALQAIRSSDIGAACMGIPVVKYKVAIFALASAIAGLAGALYAHQNFYISPDSFTFSISVLLLVMVAIGGFGRYWGPFYGALLYTALPELVRQYHDIELLILGAAMIAVVGFMPGGLAYLVEKLSLRRNKS